MINKSKKVISIILSLLIIFSTVSLGASAAGSTPTVKIISFMRGEQTDLRSSELLEARVEGYDGNVRELTYKWKSTLGTYVYVYNSHNMYNINNSDGEIEIHNTDKNISGLSNMVGRTYDKEFSGVGYAWAAVYGASIKASTSLVGVLTVEVYDKNGKLLCSDSHEGKYSNRKNSGFLSYNLDKDMDNVVIGMFEGDKRNVKDLLGESAVVHITCTASTVASGKVETGDEYIDLYHEEKKENADYGEYYIIGTVAGNSTDSNGDAKVDLKITKGNCKFHNESSGTATTTVFVFKKPTTDTTSTTLTLTGNLDDRCDYFIGGVEGTEQDDGTIIFTGLTPNTSYTVEVRGEYKDNNNTVKYAYAYVYDTTKPVYQATVNTYLDGVATDISDIHGDDVTLYLHEDKENAEYIPLEKSAVGKYTATVINGVYFPWHIEAGDHYHQAREYKLIIENANGELNLHHYSVTYDTNGGAFKTGEEVAKENLSSGVAVTATENVPVREGYVFTGWKYADAVYAPGAQVTSSITAPITLVAQWEKSVNVQINVTINHKVDGGYDYNDDKDELTVSFLEQTKDSPAFIETGDVLFFSKETVTDEKGNEKDFTYSDELQGDAVLMTKYTANTNTYTYEGLAGSSYFGVALSKSGYDVKVNKKQDTDGNWIIDIELTYNPDDFDLDFSVRMADDVPKELYPDAVIVKIACWDEAKDEWVIITQQKTTENTVRPGVRVDIDPKTGAGAGSYPVWRFDSNLNPYGYRAVVAGFIYDNSTVIVPTEKDHTKDDGKVIITYTDGNYTATMGNVSDGMKYSTSLYGAYYNKETNAQQGTLDSVISVEKYNVTFDAKGGKVNGKDKDVASEQFYVPSFADYKPVMEKHNFLGWYLDEECTVHASEGVLLTENITLYAKWDRVINGTLIVDGYYEDEKGVLHAVNASDRATQALIELEEITNDGTYNIDGRTVDIVWNGEDHFSEEAYYEFTGLDPDKNYRIDVYLINYDASYQNSTTVINGNGDIHDDYDKTHYTAVYTDEKPLETFVNTFLNFVPEVYFQDVEVDATRIGEDFRPVGALVEYLGKEAGSDTDYGIIIQHEVEPFGVEVGMDKSTGLNNGIYGCEIWKKVFNGNLYDYQANLTKLDGKSLNDWPVIVTYGDSVRWSPYNQAPTAPLKVTVIPQWYYVTYVWNDGTDYSESVSRGHIWSHETVINKEAPQRVGYAFGGWYSNPECTGEPVTKIAADVAADTTLYAKWTAIEGYALTVKHVDKNNVDKVLKTDVRESQAYDKEIKASELVEDFTGYTYVSASADSVKIGEDNEKNIITLYYTANSYDYTVNYLEEGTDKVLAESKNGTAVYGSEIVENAVAVKGYVAKDGIKTAVINEKDNVINFYYVPDTFGYTVNYLEEGTDKVLSDAKKATAEYGETVTEDPAVIKGYSPVSEESKSIVIDTENNVINFYYTADLCEYQVLYCKEGTNTEISERVIAPVYYGKTVTVEPKLIDGYVLVDEEEKTVTVDEEKEIIVFYYAEDKFGNGEYGDNVPDKYQKKIIFKVVNGTWSNDKNAEIVKYVTLLKDGVPSVDGTAALTGVPTGMKAVENFGNGLWDVTPPATVSGTEDAVYTYTFLRNATPVEPKAVKYFVEHYKALEDGSYADEPTDKFIYSGEIGKKVNAAVMDYEGYSLNSAISTVSGTLKSITSAEDILVLKLYYDADKENGGDDNTDTPDTPVTPDVPETPETPDTPDTPEIPGGEGEGEGNGNGSISGGAHHIVFGKTDGIGWYSVSKDEGQTWDIVFGNSTYEVDHGTELIIKAGDLMGDSFTFYVNGDAVKPNDNGEIRVTVKGYMLIGAIGIDPDIDFEVPDAEESLNWFQKIIKAIKDFFAKLFGKK